jgi:nitroreductase
MVPCCPGRIEGASLGAQAGFWGSFLPAVWSFMLALRSRGLGSAWVTMNLARPEGERETAEILGIPFEHYTQAGMFPIGYTIGTDFKPIATPLVVERVHWNRW